MKLFEFQNMILTGNLKSCYVFTGSDYALVNIYIENIAKRLGYTKIVCDSVESVFADINRVELFPENKIYVLKHIKVSDKDLERFLELEDNKVIYVCEAYKGKVDIDVVDFSPQDDKTFCQMVCENCKMNVENIKELGKMCGRNYGRFIEEYNKVQNYSQCEGITEDESFKRLKSSGTIKSEISEGAYDFINSVLSRKSNILELYSVLKQSGDSEIGLLYLLYSSIRNQYIVQNVENITEESTGLSKGTIWACRSRIGVFNSVELYNMLRSIYNIEHSIKSGNFEGIDTIEYFLIQAML